MKKGIYLLPNAITLCGMFAGFFAIISAFKGNFVIAAWAIVIAGVFDALDGWVARLTHTTTKFGIELDSLSDLLSFGIAPAALMYSWTLMPFGRYGWVAAFLFVACGALRLARYNVQMSGDEKKHFTGMPIPAAAGMIASTVLFYQHQGWNHEQSYYALFIIVITALLMVSTMKYHSLKEINIKERKPFGILVSFVIVFGLFFLRPELFLFCLGIIYLWGGLIENTFIFLKKPITR